MTENGPSEKLDFSMPFCSILFTDTEYTILFETPSILSELQLKNLTFQCHHSEAEHC